MQQEFARVPFARIPHQSRLFLNYLGLTAAALRFYQRPPTLRALADFSRAGLAGTNFRRKEICEILRTQNEGFGSDTRCLQHIEDLAQPDCLAVVTGQQVGLFAGPLYNVYKAFTAIRIAKELRSQGIPAVPVFWMDTDDHDLAEVTRCTVLGTDSLLHGRDYRQLLFGCIPEFARPVGSIEFPGTVSEAIDDYLLPFPETNWKPSMRSRLESAYRPGVSFAAAFARLLAQLFAGHGLILFDPRDPGAKRLASSVFLKALQGAEEIHNLLAARNGEIDAAGFHTQVSVLENSTVLFLHDQDERRALVREDSHFSLKTSGHQYSLDQLLQIALEAPERFSPNVLLRPIVQDTLLPTVCYVSGPGEIAYYAQIEALYRWYGRPMPVIWPRASLTLLDSETAEAMSRSGLALEDCLHGEEHVLEHLLRTYGNGSVENIIDGVEQELTKGIEELRPVLVAAENSLGAALETARRKIVHHLEGLRVKFVQHEAHHNDALLKRAELTVNECYPNKRLQERELGICQFYSRYGPEVLEAIDSSIDIDDFVHRVIVLS